MTTATTPAAATRTEPKFCAQSYASIASLAILVHFVHEVVVLFGDVSLVQPAVGLVAVAATLGVTGAWYHLARRTRRSVAVVLGALWALAASEHVINAVQNGSALDYTGVLTFAGGLTLIFAAYWDHRRPLDVA